jgi:hypothetical protein
MAPRVVHVAKAVGGAVPCRHCGRALFQGSVEEIARPFRPNAPPCEPRASKV